MDREDGGPLEREKAVDLSEMELSILERRFGGATLKQVAADLGLTEVEVVAHEETIFTKLGTKERSARVMEHLRSHGLPPPARTHRARWIVLVVAVLALIGFGVALFVPLGACPHGGSYRAHVDGSASCVTSDVGYATRALTPHRVGIAIMSGLLALGPLATFLFRRGQVGAD